jgi:NDP-sugar pyrophosphorylase family protein
MAEINNKPFMDILIAYTAGFGFRRFILCAGHMAGIVAAHYKNSRQPFEIIPEKRL